MKSPGIISLGYYVPKKLGNLELSKLNNLNPNEMLEKLALNLEGYRAKKRQLPTWDIGSLEAIKNLKFKIKIDQVICCTFSGDYIYPALACKIAQLLKLEDPGCFDVMANCTGFQTGLNIAFNSVNSSNKNILVVGVAKQAPFINWEDPSSSIYFGDGACAAIVSGVKKNYGHLGSSIISNTRVYDAVRMRGGGSSYANSYNQKIFKQFYEVSGLEVWKQVVTYQPKNIKQTLKIAKLKLTDIDFFIFHQANKKLIDFLLSRLSFIK